MTDTVRRIASSYLPVVLNLGGPERTAALERVHKDLGINIKVEIKPIDSETTYKVPYVDIVTYTSMGGHYKIAFRTSQGQKVRA